MSSRAWLWTKRAYAVGSCMLWLGVFVTLMRGPVRPWVVAVAFIVVLPTVMVVSMLEVIRLPYSPLGAKTRSREPVETPLTEARAFVETTGLNWGQFPAKVRLFESGMGITMAWCFKVFVPWDSVEELSIGGCWGGTKVRIKSNSPELRYALRLYFGRKATKSGFIGVLQGYEGGAVRKGEVVEQG